MLKEVIKKLPENPGVYFFKQKKKILYIGKATSLKDRVKSYFSNDLIKTRGRLLVDMVAQADSIEFTSTDSVLEALILEAELIKKHQPYYNTREKDDKSFNYVVITNEKYPAILTIRGKLLGEEDGKISKEYLRVFGPFPFGTELREALRLIRKILPFRDTCVPNSGKPCFNCSIELCPGVCTGEISEKNYMKQVNKIIMFFEGKKNSLVKLLTKEMNAFAKKQEFEEAERTKRTIYALTHIQDISLLKSSVKSGAKSNATYRGDSGANGELGDSQSGQGNQSRMGRMEAYDIAHLSGTNMVGVMVVGGAGEDIDLFLSRGEYRKFKIRGYKTANDPGALDEVIQRRVMHPEWPYPQYVVLDGNEVQLKRAVLAWKRALTNLDGGAVQKNILPIFLSVVKDNKHKAREILVNNKDEEKTKIQIQKLKPEIIKINEEAHRFAITYHRKLRKIPRQKSVNKTQKI